MQCQFYTQVKKTDIKMSIISRNALIAEFIAGTAATAQKFQDLIQSTFNVNDDSILAGPSGTTGTWGMQGPIGGTGQGLLGPTGATFYQGLWVSSGSTPGSTNSAGITGQTIFEISGASANMYVHTGSQWIKFAGTSSF